MIEKNNTQKENKTTSRIAKRNANLVQNNSTPIPMYIC